ncbi:MAG TPA: hypothetical protein VEW42_00190 [Candidatus Eisenbacteria bacterium]|nr:hypothetical protein [Candidatus Eisenbacteria bacterium]
MKKTTKILAALVLVVAALLLTRIVLSSAFSVDGIALDGINTQLEAISKENMLLKERLYTASSYVTVASDAANLGYVEQKSQISLSGTSPLAIKQ